MLFWVLELVTAKWSVEPRKQLPDWLLNSSSWRPIHMIAQTRLGGLHHLFVPWSIQPTETEAGCFAERRDQRLFFFYSLCKNGYRKEKGGQEPFWSLMCRNIQWHGKALVAQLAEAIYSHQEQKGIWTRVSRVGSLQESKLLMLNQRRSKSGKET